MQRAIVAVRRQTTRSIDLSGHRRPVEPFPRLDPSTRGPPQSEEGRNGQFAPPRTGPDRFVARDGQRPPRSMERLALEDQLGSGHRFFANLVMV